MKVGILVVQGSFAEHANILEKLGVDFSLVRDLKSFEGVTHLIIPGGESTAMRRLLEADGLWGELESRIKNQEVRILGTCAGAILSEQFGAGVSVVRNAYGAQQDSFSATLKSEKFPDIKGVFIRAPRFKKVEGEVLATFENEPVLVEDGNFLLAAFHPELAGETRVHAYFLEQPLR